MTVALSFYSVKTSSLDTRVENNETFQSTKGSTKFKAEKEREREREREKKTQEKLKSAGRGGEGGGKEKKKRLEAIHFKKPYSDVELLQNANGTVR